MIVEVDGQSRAAAAIQLYRSWLEYMEQAYSNDQFPAERALIGGDLVSTSQIRGLRKVALLRALDRIAPGGEACPDVDVSPEQRKSAK